MGKKRVAAIFALVSLLFAACAIATEIPEKKPGDWGVEHGDEIPLLEAESQQAIDDAQIEATVLLNEVAEWLDSFFDDDRFLEEENESRATLTMALGYSKNDHLELQPRLDVRLKLPKLSRRAHLVIEAVEDSDFDGDGDPAYNYATHEDSEGGGLRAALRFFLKESDTFNLAFDAGGSWSYLYTSLRFRAIQDFGDWLGRFTNRLRWYTDDGWENRVTFDLESHFAEEFFFRATTTANYYEEQKGLFHSQHFRFYQVLDSIRAIVYETGMFLETEPSYRISDLQLIVRYRQRFYRDWLMLEISPRVTFPEDHDHKMNPGLLLKLEASFGNNAGEKGFRRIFK